MFKRKSLSNIVISVFLMFGSNLNSYAMGNKILRMRRKSPLSSAYNNKKENIDFSTTLETEDTSSVDESEIEVKGTRETKSDAANSLGENFGPRAMGNKILKMRGKSPLSSAYNNKKEGIDFNTNLKKEDLSSVDESEVEIKDQSKTQYAANDPLGEDFRWNNHIPGYSGQRLDSDTAFLDYLFRDVYVKRWNNLNSRENHCLSEHSAHTAYIAHWLSLKKNMICKNEKDYEPLDPYYAVTLALYHDSLEIFTGDMPTTTKYRTKEMKPIYSKVESMAASEFMNLVPKDFKEHYKSLISPDKEDPHVLIVKEADIIENYIISLKEVKLGSRDFIEPCRILKNQINKLAKTNPEVKYFVDEVLPRFERRLRYNLYQRLRGQSRTAR